MKKKLLMALLMMVTIVVVGGLWFKIRYDQMAHTLRTIPIEDVDLGQIDDGVYTGQFGEFLVSVTLQVTVKDHRITEIEVMHQRSGEGYEARETINRILETQSPRVDAVTGATGSSKCIMAAVQKALSNYSTD